MSDDDIDDDIIAESSSPLPAGALYSGSPPIELGFRYHRPKYSSVDLGVDDFRDANRYAFAKFVAEVAPGKKRGTMFISETEAPERDDEDTKRTKLPCKVCGELPCQCCEVCNGPCRGH